MSTMRFICLVVLLSLVTIACSEDDSIAGSSSPTLVVINTEYSTSDTNGQAIGIVPAIDTTAKYVRYATGMTPATPRRPLIKDLPQRLTQKVSAADPVSRAITRTPLVITDSTTTWSFSAYNADDTQVTINATKRASGTNCYVFVENGEEGTHDWQAVASLFDSQVWTKNTGIFGTPTDVDGNGKVVILYFKMRKNDNSEEPNILGYFFPGDLITGSLPAGVDFSNRMEVFYMNLSFGEPLHSEMQRTLFHEFQHMINYGQRRISASKPEMDIWLNEGLAESAEHYGLGTPGSSRIESMNTDSSGYIRNGMPLLVWFGDDANYGLSYTFVQYCRLQTGRWDIMTELINHAYGDYRALETVVGQKVSEIDTFDKMLKAYHIARLVNGSGIHGFKDENSTFRFTLRPPTDSLDSFKLMPGGAIFLPVAKSSLDDFTPSGNGPQVSFYKHQP